MNITMKLLIRKYMTHKRLALSIELGGILIILFVSYLLGSSLSNFTYEINNSSEVGQITNNRYLEIPTTVYDINGNKITSFFRKNRRLSKISEIPSNLINAFIVGEDKLFYQHKGVDISGLIRAAVKNIAAWRVVEGGSTITQQLAKQLFTKKERTYSRKFKELKYTLRLEKSYTKSEILEFYFNKIDFGHEVYGVKAAAMYFFGKRNLNDLSVVECAMLAAILPAPNKFSPFKNRTIATVRLKKILKKMIKKGYTSRGEVDKSYEHFWNTISINRMKVTSGQTWTKREDKAPYFSEYIRKIAQKTLVEELGYKEDYLKTGGLKIYTTLNLEKQEIARQHVRNQLEKQDRIYSRNSALIYKRIKNQYTDVLNFIGYTNKDHFFQLKYKQYLEDVQAYINENVELLSFISSTNSLYQLDTLFDKHAQSLRDYSNSLKAQGALISIEPSTGYIVAMIGGRRFTRGSQFNRAVLARRQAGSTFKTFVYGAALLRGYGIGTIVGYKGPRRSKRNKKGKTKGSPVYLANAIKYSINKHAVETIKNIGPQRVVNFAAPLLGIDKKRLPVDPSLALGSASITPFELCRAMAIIANDGKEVVPIAILRIEDKNGNIIKDYVKDAYAGKPKRIISPLIARSLTYMLAGVIRGGTGSAAAHNAGFYRQAAGKTGSTNGYKDAWFAGFTANLSTVVWVGFDKGMSLGYHQYGGEVAAPIWARFMRDAHHDLPNLKLKYAAKGGMKKAPWVKDLPEPKDETKDEEVEDLDEKNGPSFISYTHLLTKNNEIKSPWDAIKEMEDLRDRENGKSEDSASNKDNTKPVKNGEKPVGNNNGKTNTEGQNNPTEWGKLIKNNSQTSETKDPTDPKDPTNPKNGEKINGKDPKDPKGSVNPKNDGTSKNGDKANGKDPKDPKDPVNPKNDGTSKDDKNGEKTDVKDPKDPKDSTKSEVRKNGEKLDKTKSEAKP